MIHLKRTDSTDPDFIKLVRLLDAHIVVKDGDMSNYYAQFNTIEKIRHVIVAYADGEPLGCGSIKAFDANSMEVKRMYVKPEARGKGIASKVLKELEAWTKELGFDRSVLETGREFKEAINLYSKWGYQPIPNYGPYIGVEQSLCFEKML